MNNNIYRIEINQSSLKITSGGTFHRFLNPRLTYNCNLGWGADFGNKLCKTKIDGTLYCVNVKDI